MEPNNLLGMEPNNLLGFHAYGNLGMEPTGTCTCTLVTVQVGSLHTENAALKGNAHAYR